MILSDDDDVAADDASSLVGDGFVTSSTRREKDCLREKVRSFGKGRVGIGRPLTRPHSFYFLASWE